MCISSLLSELTVVGDASINLLTNSVAGIDFSFLVILIKILKNIEKEKVQISSTKCKQSEIFDSTVLTLLNVAMRCASEYDLVFQRCCHVRNCRNN